MISTFEEIPNIRKVLLFWGSIVPGIRYLEVQDASTSREKRGSGMFKEDCSEDCLILPESSNNISQAEPPVSWTRIANSVCLLPPGEQELDQIANEFAEMRF